MKAILRTKDGLETIVNDHQLGRSDYVRSELPDKIRIASFTADEFEETKLEARRYIDRGERVPILEEI